MLIPQKKKAATDEDANSREMGTPHLFFFSKANRQPIETFLNHIIIIYFFVNLEG